MNFLKRYSKDALHAVLGAVIAPGPPIIARFRDKPIDVAESLVKLHALVVGEKS